MNKSIEEMKEELEKLKKECIENNNKINELLQDSAVKKYNELVCQSHRLEEAIKDLEYSSKVKEMIECEHVFVCVDSGRTYDYEGRSYPSYQCIKCGLTNYYYVNDFPEKSLTPIKERMESIYLYEKKHQGFLLGKGVVDVNNAKEEFRLLKAYYRDKNEKEILKMLQNRLYGEGRVRK